MTIEWDRIGQSGFDRHVEAPLRMFDGSGLTIVVNERGGYDGIDVRVTTEVGRRILRLKYHPDGFPGSLKGRRACVKKSFHRAMTHKPDERPLFPGSDRIAQSACLVLIHSRQHSHLISAPGLLTQTNRPLSRLHVPTHPRRRIKTDKPIQPNRSTRAGVLNRGADREARSVPMRCCHLRLSREDLPPGSGVCDLVRGGDLKQRAQPSTPLASAPTRAYGWSRGQAASSGSADCPQPCKEGEIA
ncbi:hypothetical protein AB0F07_23880 [Streptomyces fructofermentans]|uniref:hypothetical protein n=1 Tax=Streptomyces fructofermentans TaxID=152141 RepID=UPI00340D4FEC